MGVQITTEIRIVWPLIGKKIPWHKKFLDISWIRLCGMVELNRCGGKHHVSA